MPLPKEQPVAQAGNGSALLRNVGRLKTDSAAYHFVISHILIIKKMNNILANRKP